MKSCWIRTVSGKATLEYRDIPTPEPKPGELIVEVYAAGLNRGELIVGGVMHGGPEKIGGTEAAGVVHALGAGVTGFKRGDRVMGRARGGFAQYATMGTHEAMPVPGALTWEQAAAIPASGLAAYDALHLYGPLKPREWILVTAASSAVGAACIQLAKLIGARIIGTSGSAEKLQKLKSFGLEFGIETRAPDFSQQVRALTGGEGVKLAVNCVGGSYFPECMRSLAILGRLATVGYSDGVYRNEIDLRELHGSRHAVFGVSNARLTAEQRAETVKGFMRDVWPALANGDTAPVVDRVFDFDQIPAAKAYLESNGQVGKIVARGPVAQ
jgi:NADPH:quinone reductase-like Zn-dependent oxidoreductase